MAILDLRQPKWWACAVCLDQTVPLPGAVCDDCRDAAAPGWPACRHEGDSAVQAVLPLDIPQGHSWQDIQPKGEYL